MGIRFLDSILILVAAVAAVFGAYLVGHALSSHATWAWIAAAGSFGGAILVGFITTRRVRGYARAKGEGMKL